MSIRPGIILLAASSALAPLAAADRAITVYNQNFGLVRETVPLDLKPGVNQVRFNEITYHVEPDSVILRDPAGQRKLQILEQNYRADPISQDLLLSLYEGKTINFLVAEGDKTKSIPGKIIRSGYVPHTAAYQRYGQQYAYAQASMAYGETGIPIVEVDGVVRFGLPGTPLFPTLTDDTILKPMLQWQIETDTAGRFDAELCYVTGGMSWKADYNLIARDGGDKLDLVGWVTIDNQTGRTFDDAQIKLMAGDVNKAPAGGAMDESVNYAASRSIPYGGAPPVSEKTFDEYHLYTLNRRTTLRDRQTKQVEFVRADGVTAQRLYVYDGVDLKRFYGWDYASRRQNSDYGTDCNTKIWVMREFANTQASGLGMPLPGGRVRFYQRDSDGRLEFLGENNIDHTPRDERVRVYTGNAFDIVGERRRVDFRLCANDGHCADETFEIKVRNHKQEAVEVRVVEHLYRWINWEIVQKSQDFTKTDATTIEFRVGLKPDEEGTVTYKVHYSW